MRVVLAVGVLCGACGGDVGGPITRIGRLTECAVPPDAVRVHDHLEGDAETFVMFAKVVIPKGRMEAFVASCGFQAAQLQPGYDHHEMRPDEPPRWWNIPDRQLGRGARREAEGFASELVSVERDTDFAIYVRSSGRAP
ncbi:MAG: hypothetical protein AAGE52_16650 [Myxococcota bacterium]